MTFPYESFPSLGKTILIPSSPSNCLQPSHRHVPGPLLPFLLSFTQLREEEADLERANDRPVPGSF